MKNKYKKICISINAGIMTSLICLAMPGYASDIELYKAPQASETTLMFMLDVSGSMNPESNDYRENRLESLKNGMTSLLQGSSSQGISPIPDNLVVGLATFGGSTGRIKVEAKALGTPIPLAGQRQVFRTITDYTKDIKRTKTITTVTTEIQERTQKIKSKCSLWIIICLSYERDGSNWSPSDVNAGWINRSPSTNTPPSDPEWQDMGAPRPIGNAVAQECIDWNNDYTCKTWVASTKTPEDFADYTVNTSSDNYVQGSVVAGAEQTLPTETGNWTTPTNGNESCNKNECTRTQTRTKTMTVRKTVEEFSSWTYETTAVYGGVAYETHRKRLLREVKALTAIGSTPTAQAYAEVAAYMLGQSTKDKLGSGFNESSVGEIRTNSTYLNPTQINQDKQCNTQGIYFLTDGVPQYRPANSARDIMRATLNDNSFECNNTTLTNGRNFSDGETSKTNWQCIASLATRLKNGTVNDENQPLSNPKGVSILTAVVGFGKDFTNATGTNANDVAAAREWGELGGGKYYSGSDDRAVVSSVLLFLKDLTKYIPPVTTGSVTIPVDALDTQNIQPWGYFPQFDPKPDALGAAGVSIWLGNLKKYKVIDQVLYDKDNQTITNSNGLIKDDINDFWADSNVTKVITKEIEGTKQNITVKVGGALSKIQLGYNSALSPKERRIFTDRTIVQDTIDTTQNKLGSISSGTLKQLGRDDFLSTSTNKFKEDPKRAYLLSLFGYPISKDLAYNVDLYPKQEIYQTELEVAITQEPKRDWLMGAVMHSKPILLTQQGTTDYVDNVLTFKNRDDLIVYGSTQGILHVMRAGTSASDEDAGKEIFAFVPAEMIENQPKAFLSQDNQVSDLKYGIDGQWTAHTEYITKSTSTTNANPTVTVKGGKQWLYGGLRMGGKSYYSLDLSDVTSSSGTPKLKFKIIPSGACSSSNPLGCMGQSWSKPTITWVNWQGKRKLVMLVGGGYDERYESSVDYNPSGTDEGAGIYMFDADDGSLLWWASANVGSGNTATNKYYDANLKRSVVGGIKAVDRNADGIADHLYFGDLGGQIWRVDINSNKNAGMSGDRGENFAQRVVRILDISGTDAPRFYTTPTFTIHNSNNVTFGLISIGAGNLSYPMAAKDNNKEAIYVIYDKDVARRNLSVLKDNELYTKDVKISATGGNELVKNQDGNTLVPLSKGGWYYVPGTKKRILNDHVAIDNDLYVSVFDATIDLNTVGCSGGVRGESKTAQFCLPFGQCTVKKGNTTEVVSRPNDIFLGKGNIGISFGGDDTKRGLVLNLPTTESLKTYQGKTKFISQRWYER